MSRRHPPRLGIALLALALAGTAPAATTQASTSSSSSSSSQSQPSSTPPPAVPETESEAPLPPPKGKIIFSRDGNLSGPAQSSPPATTASAVSRVTDAQREAVTFTAYDLDVHLVPASSSLSVRAVVTLKNDGDSPLSHIALQITSTAHWDAFSSAGAALEFTSQTMDTDADHTGQVQEATLNLPRPLAPGSTIVLTCLYSGSIVASAHRLERIGAPATEAAASDWDAIAEHLTALRGFGNVLWYPVSAPPRFLDDGARLFEAVGRAKLRESVATARLRLAIEYTGDPPDAAFFCGRSQHLTAISDNADAPAAISPGIATADFPPQPVGFRTLNLFVTPHPPTETGTPAHPNLIAAVTDHYDALPAYSAAASLVEPMLTEWLGPGTQTALTVLDHSGQPFEDDALLVRPLRTADPASLAPSLAHSLTHAWIHSRHAWIDEGLPEFFALVWTERSRNRIAALTALQGAARTLAEAELATPSDSAGSPANSTSTSSSAAEQPHPAVPVVNPAGASLIAATGDLFYRTKAAAVWWMLRGITGDEALKQALQAYRSDAALDADPEGFERTLEKASHKGLRWFFDDWVYRDRGLPDLSIATVAPSQLQARNGLPAGWLVAVEVRNDGEATAEVPVTIRAGDSTQTQRLRIPGRSSASTRIVFPGQPEQIEVNDGSVPESHTSLHTRQLMLAGH